MAKKKKRVSNQGHKRPSISGNEVLRIVSDAIAFSKGSWLAMEETKKLGADQVDYNKPIHGDRGWPAGEVWESLQTVSHFNLAISLELALKALIRLDRPQHQQREPHNLSILYGRLAPSTRNRLEAAWTMIDSSIPVEFVGYVNAHQRPEPPRLVDFNNLRDWLCYFDRDMQMYTKRYSWENIAKGRYRLYIKDLRLFYDLFEILRTLVLDRAKDVGVLLPDKHTDDWKRSMGYLAEASVDLEEAFYEKSGWHKDSKGRWTKKRTDGSHILVHRPDLFWKMLIEAGENFLSPENRFAWSSIMDLGSGGSTEPVFVAELTVGAVQ